MPRLTKTFMVGVVLTFLAACNILDEGGDSESGIAGDGAVSGSRQTSVGDGSALDWTSASCMLVEGKTIWTWLGDPNKFTIHDSESPGKSCDPGHADEDKGGICSDITIRTIGLANCGIETGTTIAYTTKNWLCVNDYVKINGADCLITVIKYTLEAE